MAHASTAVVRPVRAPYVPASARMVMPRAGLESPRGSFRARRRYGKEDLGPYERSALIACPATSSSSIRSSATDSSARVARAFPTARCTLELSGRRAKLLHQGACCADAPRLRLAGQRPYDCFANADVLDLRQPPQEDRGGPGVVEGRRVQAREGSEIRGVDTRASQLGHHLLDCGFG